MKAAALPAAVLPAAAWLAAGWPAPVWHTAGWLAAILFLSTVATAQAPAVIHQSTTGWCSPVIANVTGNVTVNCIGVDPRALTRLNAQLAKKNQQLNASIAEANQWVERYNELDAQLKAAGSNSELSKQAQEYVHQGDFEKAREILDRLLKQDASEQSRIATDYFQRGLISQLEFKPLEALPDFERAYTLSPDNLRFARRYASDLIDVHEFARAEPVLDAAIQQAPAAVAKNRADRPHYPWLLYNRATLLTQTTRFTAAERDYLEALALFRDLAKEKPDLYQLLVSMVLIDLGSMYRTLNRLRESESVLEEALAIQRSLPQGETQQGFVSLSLENLAQIYFQNATQGNQAIQFQGEAVATFRELAKNKPAIYEPELAQALNNLANFNLGAGNPREAERAAVEATEISNRVAAFNPQAHRPKAAMAFTTLAYIYQTEHRNQDAELAFQKALTIDRQLVADSPQAFNRQLAVVLGEMAQNYQEMGRTADAIKAADESLSIFRRLAETNFDAFGQKFASSASFLGRIYLEQHNPAAAPLLSDAADAYRRLSAAKPNVFDPTLALNLQLLAVALAVQKDSPRARKAAEESLAIFNRLRSANAPFDHESLARSMIVYAGLIEHENFTRACSMVGDAGQFATEASTRQTSQAAYDTCRRNRAYHPAR